MKLFLFLSLMFLLSGCASFLQNLPPSDSSEVSAACTLLCISTRDVELNQKQIEKKEVWKGIINPALCQQLCESAYGFVAEEIQSK